MMQKIRIDEAYCQECRKWYHWSELHKEEPPKCPDFPDAILDWLDCPKGHVIGIMAKDPRTPTSKQLEESMAKLRRR